MFSNASAFNTQYLNSLQAGQYYYGQQQVGAQQLGIAASPNPPYTKYPSPRESTKESKEMFSIYGQVKEFIRSHRDVLFTILAVVLLDKYLLNGALRDRVQKLVEAILARAESLITPKQ